MIDIVYPDEDYNSWRYAQDARKVIQDRIDENPLLIVGGSGLYLRALIDGFFVLPNNEECKKVRQTFKGIPTSELYEKLKEVDPDTAKRLHPNDRQRITRALEVFLVTNRPMSYWQNTGRLRAGFNPIYIGLICERSELKERIAKRVNRMIELGFVEEVKHLLEMGYSKELNSLRTIGYKEIIEYLEGKITFEHAIYLIKKHTIEYAKRQITWFKRLPNVNWINIYENPIEKIQLLLRRFLLV